MRNLRAYFFTATLPLNSLEKQSFKSYKKLLTAAQTHLEPQQYALLTNLGLNLAQDAHGYILRDLPCYHATYRKEKFSQELQPYVRLEEIVSSTLDLIPTEKYQLIIAEAQTHGRGQHGKSFYSALGRQILLTYHFPGRVRPLEGLWALWRLLAPYGVAYKWPNDLYLPCGKIAGFLSTQTSFSSHVSFGLNLSLTNNPLLGSLKWLPSEYQRESIISQWVDLFWQAKTQDYSTIVSDLTQSSMIAVNEEVFFQDRIFLFHGFNEDGSVRLYDPNTLKILTIYSGSLLPATLQGWGFVRDFSLKTIY